MKAKLGEKLKHLSKISCVTMRIQKREWSCRVLNIRRNHLIPSFRLQLQYFNILLHVLYTNQLQLSSHHLNPVRRRIWREKRKLRRHWWRHRPHYNQKNKMNPQILRAFLNTNLTIEKTETFRENYKLYSVLNSIMVKTEQRGNTYESITDAERRRLKKRKKKTSFLWNQHLKIQTLI